MIRELKCKDIDETWRTRLLREISVGTPVSVAGTFALGGLRGLSGGEWKVHYLRGVWIG